MQVKMEMDTPSDLRFCKNENWICSLLAAKMKIAT